MVPGETLSWMPERRIQSTSGSLNALRSVSPEWSGDAPDCMLRELAPISGLDQCLSVAQRNWRKGTSAASHARKERLI
jgi:hypothetical protein